MSDGAQSLNLDEFAALMPQLARVAAAVDRSFSAAGVEAL
jgi:3-deoxy-D-arabino-heptulosonate 7-phosphate (DAHP) synthase